MTSSLGAEFVMSSPDVLDERVASDDDRSSLVAIEAAHWSKTILDRTRRGCWRTANKITSGGN
jgi:hypothetical protein